MTEAFEAFTDIEATSPLTSLSATELARRIADGEISAVEAVTAHIERIEAVNPVLNAVILPRFDDALAEARAADALRARGAPLPALHGLPMTIKEHFNLTGLPSSWGLAGRKDDRALADDPLVATLRAAGAIVLGKTNMMQLGMGAECDNPVYGRTNNPWRPQERTCGGSSGGEGAIIAAGGSPLGFGTDLAGSIRCPASFCGIAGFKPTSGRLRMAISRGIYIAEGAAGEMAQPGPLARHVADLALAMRVLTADPIHGAGLGPMRDPAQVRLDRLRIGVFEDDGEVTPAPALRRSVREATAALQAQGAVVEPFVVPEVANVQRWFLIMQASDGGEGIRKSLNGSKAEPGLAAILWFLAMPGALRFPLATALDLAGQHGSAEGLRATARRTPAERAATVAAIEDYRARFLAQMDAGGYDALLCPSGPLPALQHGMGAKSLSGGVYTSLFNLLGFPAGVIPTTLIRPDEESDRPASRDAGERAARTVEHGSAGLPASVQVAARPQREDVALAILAALEAHFRTQPDYPETPVCRVRATPSETRG